MEVMNLSMVADPVADRIECRSILETLGRLGTLTELSVGADRNRAEWLLNVWTRRFVSRVQSSALPLEFTSTDGFAVRVRQEGDVLVFGIQDTVHTMPPFDDLMIDELVLWYSLNNRIEPAGT